jgi:hypothetical protein
MLPKEAFYLKYAPANTWRFEVFRIAAPGITFQGIAFFEYPGSQGIEMDIVADDSQVVIIRPIHQE